MHHHLSLTSLCFFLAIIALTSILSTSSSFNNNNNQMFLVLAEEEDYFKILGLDEDATEADIKKQFRKLSKKYHPDLNKDESSRERYKKIQAASAVLSDKKKRKIYEMRGEEGLKQLEEANRGGGGGGGHHMMDPFADFFGGGGGGGQQQQHGGVKKGADAQMNLQVPLAEIYTGGSHKISINKQKLCKTCKGSGAAKGPNSLKVCDHCHGSGQVVQKIQLMPGMYQQVQQPCPRCGGKGKMIKKKCPTCKGQKVIRGSQQLDVEIEQGVPDGHRIVHEMEADQSPDQLPGDVIFIVQTQPDPQFSRRGDDLDHSMKLSLKEALLGFNKRIVHMDGHGVSVDREEVTQHGYRMALAGEGMPKHQVPSEKGTLYVTFNVQLPKKLNAKQREVLASVLNYEAPEFEDAEESEE